ncbi:MAG: pseudaminic acid cytidylyltransferase [Bacteroides sp.]|nr:pseudaminic acid cytidylyltransferase [Bacteroides sp.]MCM1549024.1 pseudaminic acid cytidylyltransferase [Clostridium sp.]
MKALAVVVARGGSKRIPKKNIRSFCGKPIISYSIKSALDSNLFDEVMVSTDSEEIAEIARTYGASIPFMRSEINSGDFATTDAVMLEVVERYREMGYVYDYACCLYPTAPFITSEILIEAMEKMKKNNPAMVFPVVQFSYPPQRCFIIEPDGYAVFKYPQYVQTRSQDLDKLYHDAGQFYVYNVDKLIQKRAIIEDDFLPIIISELQVQDIDNEVDWKLAEMKYKLLNGKEEENAGDR